MINITLELWENLEGKKFKPKLDAYILSGNKKRPVILICPGGGYTHTSDKEGEPVAMQFAAAGFHTAVLHYSVAPAKHPQPLLDVSRAVCLLRENAEEWNIDTEKIVLCGFSAGGHLAATLGVHWNKPYLYKTVNNKKGFNRPNALILCYPVITTGEFTHAGSFENLLGTNPSKEDLLELSLDHHVTKYTAPTFIWHTVTDYSVPVENTLLFAGALCREKVSFELHIYPEGPHGMSLATKETSNEKRKRDAHVATWMTLCIQWLDKIF